MTVIWQELPKLPSVAVAPMKNAGRFMPQLSELMTQPGRWGVIFEGALTSAMVYKSQLTQGRATRPPGAFEFEVRKGRGNSSAKLFGRYVGAA